MMLVLEHAGNVEMLKVIVLEALGAFERWRYATCQSISANRQSLTVLWAALLDEMLAIVRNVERLSTQGARDECLLDAMRFRLRLGGGECACRVHEIAPKSGALSVAAWIAFEAFGARAYDGG